MNKSEVIDAMHAVAEARSKWRIAHARFNSATETIIKRMLLEAAAQKMSMTEVGKALGLTQTKTRALMRKHGLNPRDGINLLSRQAAATLEENAALMGVEPKDFDLMSPLAYLPMGKELRTFLQVPADVDEVVSAYNSLGEAVHDLHLRGGHLREGSVCPTCGLFGKAGVDEPVDPKVSEKAAWDEYVKNNHVQPGSNEPYAFMMGYQAARKNMVDA